LRAAPAFRDDTAVPDYWLEGPSGVRLPIKPSGLVIGRAAHCDLVADDPAISRAQAIVFAGPSGPALTVLGRAPTYVDDVPVEHGCELGDGARVVVPGLSMRVVYVAAAAPPPTTWVVRGPGGLFGVVRSPFTVGGAGGSDLIVDGWPPEVFRFHVTERLHLEACVDLTVDGVEQAAGEVIALDPGSTVRHGDVGFEIVTGGSLGQDTTLGTVEVTDLPTEVGLQFLARGGRLTALWRGRSFTVYLPERRCDLIAALLQPPAPFVAGEFVPDDVLLPRIWPGKAMTRVDLNVLLRRARLDLVRADLDGPNLLVRSDGGTATCFRLAPSARVRVS
jgi:hypothetical protein